ncbi:hypothetical protein ZWY2020_003548 [Hordeum vulgare]|nr:hypothetical protein ZWY2020_003548 [Hordeum vulgare]
MMISASTWSQRKKLREHSSNRAAASVAPSSPGSCGLRSSEAYTATAARARSATVASAASSTCTGQAPLHRDVHQQPRQPRRRPPTGPPPVAKQRLTAAGTCTELLMDGRGRDKSIKDQWTALCTWLRGYVVGSASEQIPYGGTSRASKAAGDQKKAKKKKKNPKPSAGGVLIVDEDPVWQKPVQIEEDEPSSGDEKPQVNEDIEVKRMRRMEAIRAARPYNSIANDGSGWVTLPVPEPAGSGFARRRRRK